MPRAILACRHCGSRAGRERPDELTTAEALDLVRQMADLGVKEVTLIGGEAYLRDDWLDIVRAVRARGMMCTMTTGGRGMTRERRAAARPRACRACRSPSTATRETHDPLRASRGSDAAIAGCATSRRRREGRRQHADQPRHLADLAAVHAAIAAEGAHGWQVQLTVADGPRRRRARDPAPALAGARRLPAPRRPQEAQGERRQPLARQQRRLLRPVRDAPARPLPRGHGGSCGAGRVTLGIEANGDIKGCPSLPTDRWTGGRSPRSSTSRRGARRPGALLRVADPSPGFPCRVSLCDAEPGETVLLVHYEHQPAASPFRASHAVYVRRGAVQAHPAPGEVPEMLRRRLLSVRAFDDAGMRGGAGARAGDRAPPLFPGDGLSPPSLRPTGLLRGARRPT